MTTGNDATPSPCIGADGSIAHSFPNGPHTCACGDLDLSHDFVVAAIVHVTTKIAKHAAFRGSFRTQINQRIDALEVYCHGCRRPYDDVADEACAAKIDNTHLIGGDPGVRKKRKVFAPEGEVIAGPGINRMGTAAYVTGDAAPVG